MTTPQRSKEDVLQSLFPGIPMDDLMNRPHEDLLRMLKSGTDSTNVNDIAGDDDQASLDQLQPLPEATTERLDNASETSSSREAGITDDVNALSLSVKHSTSYLGISSVIAVLRVIHWLDPQSKAVYAGSTRSEQQPAPAKTVSMWDEVPAINAYFQYVQPYLPLLDEDAFRNTYLSRERKDDRWQLLLNTVLAMGSVALHDATDQTHTVFYERAKQYLNLDAFGSAHIETLQAMAILTGTYLHYIQEPNLANSLMGAISRMATTLGLHRDYTEGLKNEGLANAMPWVELRRRVWWCLLIMDCWNSNFLGRPTMGRIGPGHTTRIPEKPTVSPNDQQCASLTLSQNGCAATTALIQANIEYCKLSTRFENLLAERPILSTRNRQELDAAFSDWHRSTSSLPPEGPDKPGIIAAFNAARWKSYTARIFIHRPLLLWYAMRKMPWARLSEEKREAIEMCRAVANELIRDIEANWSKPVPSQIVGWHATWQLYQATMVPLLSLFCDSDNEDVIARSQTHIEMAQSTLSKLERWSPTARRSFEVVSRLYEQAKAYRPQPTYQDDAGTSVLDTPSTTESATMYDGFFMHDFIGDLNWNGDQTLPELELEHSFLDYWDVGQEANRLL